MSFGIAFVVLFILALLVISFLASYARHMGQPEPTNWLVVIAISAGLALVGSGVVHGLWSLGIFILAGVR